MNAFRVLALCIAAAFVCASLRTLHPQIATAIAFAAGIAALTLSIPDIRCISDAALELESFANQGGETRPELLKVCAIALIAEFASDLCRDAGEAALARRIDTGTKIGIVAAAIPAASQIMDRIVELLT